MRTVTMEGTHKAAPLIIDATPLASVALDTPFELHAVRAGAEVRDAARAAGAFTEHNPIYGLAYGDDVVAVSSVLEGPVRCLIEQDYDVVFHGEKTTDEPKGYEGLSVEMPARNHLEDWYAFAKYGVAIPLDASVEVVNLPLLGEEVEGGLKSGPVTVAVLPGADDHVKVVIDGTYIHSVYPREHGYKLLEKAVGAIVAHAVVEVRDSFVEKGGRYLKLFLDI